MKVEEGGRIPGLESNVYGPDESVDKSVAELCEEYFEEAYEQSWVSDAFRRVDATNIEKNHYNSDGMYVTFDKYARASDLRDGWTGEWIDNLVESIEDDVVEQIRKDGVVVNNDDMGKDAVDEHFEEEYGWDNAERIRISQDVCIYLSPPTFGYDIVRTKFDADHRYGMKATSFHGGANYVIGHTRRAFFFNEQAVLYDTRDEFQRNSPESDE